MVAIYGSTEAEPIAHLEHDAITAADLEEMKSGRGLLAGHPVELVDVIIEDGEILVAGSHVNESYLDPAQNVNTKVMRDGRVWHRTGDAGRLDDEGRLWLLGRTRTRIGGVNPLGVETAARFWPGVDQSALARIDGKPILAIVGDPAHLSDWSAAAAILGIGDVRHVQNIPLDRRHRSKTDLLALERMLSGGSASGHAERA